MKDSTRQKIKKIANGLPVWVKMAARVPFLFLFAYESLQAWREKSNNTPPSSCRSVSVIIPALNEEDHIVRCIQSVSGNVHVLEIIVVDGGSTDQTRELAGQSGARLLVHEQPVEAGGGRGGQIKAGIDAAGGDVVMILHADVVLPAVEIDRVIAVLNENPGIAGGAVGCRFDSVRLRFRFIELANDMRAAFFKISFGDQVQFFRRQPVVARDMYPGIPLMEDVEISIRLHRLGRQIYLFGDALVSARRWDRIGFRNAPWVFRQVTAYLVRRLWSQPDTAKLYRKYYH